MVLLYTIWLAHSQIGSAEKVKHLEMKLRIFAHFDRIADASTTTTSERRMIWQRGNSSRFIIILMLVAKSAATRSMYRVYLFLSQMQRWGEHCRIGAFFHFTLADQKRWFLLNRSMHARESTGFQDNSITLSLFVLTFQFIRWYGCDRSGRQDRSNSPDKPLLQWDLIGLSHKRQSYINCGLSRSSSITMRF